MKPSIFLGYFPNKQKRADVGLQPGIRNVSEAVDPLHSGHRTFNISVKHWMALSKYLLAQSDHVVYRHAPQHQYALCGPASLLWGTHATDNQTNKHRRTEGSGYRRYLLPWFCHCGPTLVASDDKERKSFWLLEVYNSEQTLWSRWLDILSTDWGGMSKLGQARHRWSMVCFQYNLANIIQ